MQEFYLYYYTYLQETTYFKSMLLVSGHVNIIEKATCYLKIKWLFLCAIQLNLLSNWIHI